MYASNHSNPPVTDDAFGTGPLQAAFEPHLDFDDQEREVKDEEDMNPHAKRLSDYEFHSKPFRSRSTRFPESAVGELGNDGTKAVESTKETSTPTKNNASCDVEKAGSSQSPSHDDDDGKEGAQDEERDPNIVDWEGEDDPENPLNWSARRRWTAVVVISVITFITPLASTLFAPGVPQLMEDFHSTNTQLASFVVSVYILGFCLGPLVIAPLSEIYGRYWVINISNVVFLIFTIACAVSTNIPMFIVFRFFMGVAGSTPLTVGGGNVADVMRQEQRGKATSMWAMGPMMGPVIGPVAGGFIAEGPGWRWVFWILAIISGVINIFSFVCLKETYAPKLLARKTARLIQETGNTKLRSKYDKGETAGDKFRRAILRPTKMLFLSPIVFLLSLEMAIAYGYLYLLFTTYTYVFEGDYGFTPGEAGLTYLGTGIGSFAGLFVAGYMSDKIVQAKKNSPGGMKPEHRLPPLIPGSIFLPIGLFWYGWSAQAHTHWIVPILGTLFVGAGLLLSFMPIQTYLIDAFTLYAASASSAAAVLRSLFGAVLPLAGQSMYKALGLGWGNSLLAFIGLALVPVPFIFLKYGERIRTAKRFQREW